MDSNVLLQTAYFEKHCLKKTHILDVWQIFRFYIFNFGNKVQNLHAYNVHRCTIYI